MSPATALGVLVIAVVPATAAADDQATSPARPEYEATEKLLMWGGRERLQKRGLTVDGTYSLDWFAAPQLENRFVAAGLFTTEVDIHKRFHASAFAIHGGNISDELRDVFGTSGNAAPRDVRLFEAWFDQPIGPLTVRTGLLAVDQEFVLADRSGVLLAATFGITGQFSKNVLGPVYPIAAPGVSARLATKPIGARFAVLDGSLENRHGIPTGGGSDALVIGELWAVERFKVGAWHHTARGSAVYAITDAQLVRDLGVFARVGYSTGAVSTYIDAGFRATPRRWRRGDLVSVGIAHAQTDTGAQTMVEATYELQLRWISLQPDLQVMMLPDRTVWIIATRMTATL